MAIKFDLELEMGNRDHMHIWWRCTLLETLDWRQCALKLFGRSASSFLQLLNLHTGQEVETAPLIWWSRSIPLEVTNLYLHCVNDEVIDIRRILVHFRVIVSLGMNEQWLPSRNDLYSEWDQCEMLYSKKYLFLGGWVLVEVEKIIIKIRGESSVSLWMNMNRQMDNCRLTSKKHASQIGLSL